MGDRSGGAPQKSFDVAGLMLKGVAVLVAVIIGLSLSLAMFSETDPRGGAFDLVDTAGASVDEEILEDQISLVYFGFTYCPDFCPTEIANMAAARRLARAEGLDPQIVFIAVDPKRDTPEALREYLDAFDEGLIGLTGAAAQLDAAARAYGARFEISPPDSPDDPLGYDVVHTTLVYAVGRDARVFWRFPAMTPPDVIAKKLKEQAAG
ncbi:MAG: SCO family protein [Pseudomonadota bacterium]